VDCSKVLRKAGAFVGWFCSWGWAPGPPRRGLVHPAQGNALGTRRPETICFGPTGQPFCRRMIGPLARRCNSLRQPSPGRCPGLGEERAFGPCSGHKRPSQFLEFCGSRSEVFSSPAYGQLPPLPLSWTLDVEPGNVQSPRLNVQMVPSLRGEGTFCFDVCGKRRRPAVRPKRFPRWCADASCGFAVQVGYRCLPVWALADCSAVRRPSSLPRPVQLVEHSAFSLQHLAPPPRLTETRRRAGEARRRNAWARRPRRRRGRGHRPRWR
jgi:hypothetical protein